MSQTVLTTHRIRAYTSKQGYARIGHVLHECANLYNAALEERRDAFKRGWTATSDIPLDRKGLTAAGCWTFNEENQEWHWLKRGNLPPLEAWLFRQNGNVIHKANTPISYNYQQGQLPELRRNDEFWNSVDTLIARGVLGRLDKAMAAFFRRIKEGEKPGYPRFRSRRRYRTINLEEARPGMLKGDSLHIKGLPRIRIPSNRDLPPKCQLASLTITRKGRRLYLGLIYKVAISTFGWNSPEGLPKTGADMGITDRVALATGETIEHRQSLDEDIQRKQKRLSRCRKGSRQWRKRAATLANAQDRRRTANRQEAHRITTDIVSRFSGTGVEDLQITNLTKSNKGTETAPSANVAQKTGLNREINAQTWGTLIAMLAYKAERAGRELVKVDPKGTSQTCSGCGVIDANAGEKKILSCGACELVIDADVNAARNILEKAFPEYEPGGWEFPAADPRVRVTCAGNYPYILGKTLVYSQREETQPCP